MQNQVPLESLNHGSDSSGSAGSDRHPGGNGVAAPEIRSTIDQEVGSGLASYRLSRHGHAYQRVSLGDQRFLPAGERESILTGTSSG